MSGDPEPTFPGLESDSEPYPPRPRPGVRQLPFGPFSPESPDRFDALALRRRELTAVTFIIIYGVAILVFIALQTGLVGAIFGTRLSLDVIFVIAVAFFALSQIAERMLTPGPRRFLSRLERGRCPACGYPSLDASNLTVCPECGFDARPYLRPGTLEPIEEFTIQEWGRMGVYRMKKARLARAARRREGNAARSKRQPPR